MASPRKLSDSGIYHLVARGTGKQLIFEEDADRKQFLKILESSLNTSAVDLYAWCLMTNHFHLLTYAPEITRLSQFVRLLCGRYATWFNKKTERSGHLFQDRYKSEPVENNEYLITVLRYIHCNPVKANIARVDTYKWSSYREYVEEQRLCSTQRILDIVGGIESFKQLHADIPLENDCLDTEMPRSRTSAMSDREAIKRANKALNGTALDSLKSLSQKERNEALQRLKSAQLSIRQIERLTGIGRGIIARVVKD